VVINHVLYYYIVRQTCISVRTYCRWLIISGVCCSILKHIPYIGFLSRRSKLRKSQNLEAW